MSSRALSLATVLLLIGFGAANSVLAQATNLEAGKTPSQLFSQTCNVCHKSPRGLLKSVSPGSLPGFLRQHYTTSSDMAGVLSAYLISNGATDTRYQAKDAKKDGAAPEQQGRRQRAQDAARPDGEGAAPAAEGTRQKRAARPAEEGAKPEGEAAPETRKGKRRAKPGTEEAPKVDAAAPATDDKKSEPKPEPVKPDSAKVEPRSETPALRPDPVPQVTPAAPAAAKPAEPAAPKPVEEAAPKPAEPAPAAKPQEQAPPAAAAAPPPPPAPPASSGPPAPPISR
ncbi:hypothetical protein [Bradyrhizobium yuanmingense]|uniref:hypothetical protein n=1 Tax=Bradyrhizobium yuanmingense TaxID=108015 RepID=UPI0018DF5538|nr:hypothetical protein [Bradyrhizobium yuanmingense]